MPNKSFKMTMSELAVGVSIGVLKALVFVYDLVTYPIYAAVQQPWKKQALMEKQRGAQTPVSEGLCYKSLSEPSDLQIELARNNINTVEKALSYACKKYNSKKALGTRKILSEFDEVQKNGKIFKKYEMGEYQWQTFTEIDSIAHNFGCGLRVLGHQPKQNIVVFAETRAEWLITAMGLFKQNIPLCTLYATLGDDAIVHGVNETEVTHIVTSHDLIGKFKVLLERCPKVTHITYYRDQLNKTDLDGFPRKIICNSFEEVVEMGKKADMKQYIAVPPTPQDIAIIMYTSGSTGTPKGVVISHRNLVNSMTGYAAVLNVRPNDVYMAYLPLAHVLELMGESMMMLYGVRMGYSTPLTMTDRSTKIKRGSQGDATVLQPTFIAAVPLILDRIYKGIVEKVKAQGPFLNALFNFAIEYKYNWIRRGWDTPICNWAIFRKIRALLGGRVRIMAAGSAPLPADTHNFIRVTLGVPLLQGYGLTETCACASLMDEFDMSCERVGQPLPLCHIKLVNWEEGNYRITDKPCPRGEIIISGENIVEGYYKNPEKTAEEFFEMDGRRWFKTGDIGQFDQDGVLRIIDRKKDLVKLQFGEYVSLGKVEAGLKIHPIVENICVYADPKQNHIVMIVSPNPKSLQELSSSLGKKNLTFEQMCEDKDIEKAVLQQLLETGKKTKLAKFELPQALSLTSEPWTPDSGLVTSAFKIIRRSIQNRYQTDIDRMYGA